MENRDEVIKRFEELDDELVLLGESITIYVVGGSAIMLNRVYDRPTVDIDAFYDGNEKLDKLLNKFDINREIRIGYKKNCHEKYSVRLELPFTNLTVYVVINDYLFVMKMVAIISPNRLEQRKFVDKQDVLNMLPTINFKQAYEIANLLIKEELDSVSGEYLIKEMKEWEEYWQLNNTHSTI